MPCYDPRDDEDKVRNAQLVVEYSAKIDNLTGMLCDMCSKTPFEELPQNIRGWYSRHLDADRKRVYDSFVEKLEKFSDKVQDMSGEELRLIEESVDKINL